jgi:hypothetical protein
MLDQMGFCFQNPREPPFGALNFWHFSRNLTIAIVSLFVSFGHLFDKFRKEEKTISFTGRTFIDQAFLDFIYSNYIIHV